MDTMKHEGLLKRLTKPKGKIDVVIDTDTFNEVDDQFALSYLINSDDKVNLKAIYAAPFFNDNASDPQDGMEKSYDEIMHILTLMERDDLKQIVYKGSTRYLRSEEEAVDSDAAKNLVERALTYTQDAPLYIAVIGVGTNIASAILMNREIIDRIVIVWLSGHSYDNPDTGEFNMYQDIAAARVIYGCGAALVQVPCMGLVHAFSVTGPEFDYWLKDKNPLCTYLVNATRKHVEHYHSGVLWSRALADMLAVAWLMEEDFVLDYIVPSPIPEYNNTYTFDDSRHPIRYVYFVNRDALLIDMINKLTK